MSKEAAQLQMEAINRILRDPDVMSNLIQGRSSR
jgi:hypothetical protein